MTPSAPVDAAIIGGGPAGSAIGRLLASWGHAVLILDKGSDPARGLAESLPPSTIKLLTQVGVLDAVERAGFYRTRGNTVWWASGDRRVETFGPDRRAFGYQVFRPDFDRVLLDSAVAAGARVERGAQVRGVAVGDDEFVTVEYGLNAEHAEHAEQNQKPFSADSASSAFKSFQTARARAERAEHNHRSYEFTAEHAENAEQNEKSFSAISARSAVRALESVRARFVIDCSGRAGVVARRFRTPQPEFRTYAIVGVWHADTDWDLPDPTHTVVETFADGWAWSVPIDAATRHVGAMVGNALPDDGRSHDLTATYRSLIAKARQTASLLRRASLGRVWACDASLYSSTQYAGHQFLLVGDAGSFIDPLSSFGVKKALASAWLGAVAVHTALSDGNRQAVALGFFSDRERRMYATHLGRSREFARSAHEQHPHAFWSARTAMVADAATVAGADDTAGMASDPVYDDIARDPAVRRAFERFKDAPHLDLALSETARFEPRPVVRGHEIVLEPALAGGMRFLANVDLLTLAHIAPSCRHIPDVFEAYCRSCPPVPLPSVLGGLSLLVARGILYERT